MKSGMKVCGGLWRDGGIGVVRNGIRCKYVEFGLVQQSRRGFAKVLVDTKPSSKSKFVKRREIETNKAISSIISNFIETKQLPDTETLLSKALQLSQTKNGPLILRDFLIDPSTDASSKSSLIQTLVSNAPSLILHPEAQFTLLHIFPLSSPDQRSHLLQSILSTPDIDPVLLKSIWMSASDTEKQPLARIIYPQTARLYMTQGGVRLLREMVKEVEYGNEVVRSVVEEVSEGDRKRIEKVLYEKKVGVDLEEDGHLMCVCIDEYGYLLMSDILRDNKNKSEERRRHKQVIQDYMLDNLLEMSKHRYGSTFITQTLLHASKRTKSAVVEFALQSPDILLSLSLCRYGAYVSQSVLRCCDMFQRDRYYLHIITNLLELSMNRNGIYVVNLCYQKAELKHMQNMTQQYLTPSTPENKRYFDIFVQTLASAQSDHVPTCPIYLVCKSPVCAELLSHILQALQTTERTRVYAYVSQITHDLVSTKHGARSLRKFLQHGTAEEQQTLLEDLLQSAGFIALCEKEYASELTEEILGYGSQSQTERAYQVVTEQLVRLSCSKAGSYTVETYVKRASAAQLSAMIKQMVSPSQSNLVQVRSQAVLMEEDDRGAAKLADRPLLLLAIHDTATFIVQKVCEVAQGTNLQILGTSLRQQAPLLNKVAHGRRILALLNRRNESQPRGKVHSGTRRK